MRAVDEKSTEVKKKIPEDFLAQKRASSWKSRKAW